MAGCSKESIDPTQPPDKEILLVRRPLISKEEKKRKKKFRKMAKEARKRNRRK